MNKPWQIFLVLIAIFVAGAVSGGLVAYRILHRHVSHFPAPEVWLTHRMEHVARELQFTPDEKKRIQPIIQRNIEELSRLRHQTLRTSREILERMEQDIAAELTPEQRAKYEDMIKQRRERIRRLMEERGARGERGSPHGVMPAPAQAPAQAPADHGSAPSAPSSEKVPGS